MNYTLHNVMAQYENCTTYYKANYILEMNIKVYIYSKNFIALDHRLTHLFFSNRIFPQVFLRV